MFPHHAPCVKGFGEPFKKQVRDLQHGFYQLGGFEKVLARRDNRVTVDAAWRDTYGIPIPVMHFRFSENDRLLWKDMKERAQEVLHNAKARLIIDQSPQPSGFASHETGPVRMGHNP